MNAKNQTFLLFILVLLLPISLWSQTAQNDLQRVLEDRGYMDFSQTKNNGMIVYTASGTTVPILSFECRDGISTKTVDLIKDLYGKFSSWQNITFARVNLTLEGDTLRALLIPSRFEYQGKNLLPHIPGGLFFTTTGDDVKFDFRVKSGDYIIRFQGQLIDEHSFLNHIISAIDDPAQYIRNNDPSYLSSRIDELREQVVVLGEQNGLLITNLEQKLKEQEALIISLQAENQALKAAKDNIAAAVVAALSKGLFSAPKSPSSEIINRIIILKQQNNNATVAEIGTQLKAQGLRVSDKEIRAIIMVYFGEYD